MVTILPPSEARKHLEQAVSVIPDRYEAKIKIATWKDPAIAGEAAFKDAMSVVITEERRRKAIEKLSDDYWRDRAVKKGKPIIATRVREGLPNYEKNVAPYFEVISTLVLEPKTIDPLANVDKRVKPIVEALVKKKKELKGL